MPKKDTEPKEELIQATEKIDDTEHELATQEKPPHNWLSIVVVVVLVLVITLVGYFRYADKATGNSHKQTAQNDTTKPTITTKPVEEKKIASSLDGTLVNESLANRRPLAVMVENHVDARPQFGLGTASVIYEAIAEGGITRFMALFGPNDTTKVGPVRSVRTYYLDWALEYDAGLAHVGGNIDALDLIPQIGVNDLDEFAIGDRAFRREAHGGVALEHTMYTDTTKLRTIMDEKFGSDQSGAKLSFKEPVAKEHRPAGQSVSINFSSPQFLVNWTYDPETNTYIRSMAGSLHKDAVSGEALRAANIFIQQVARKETTTRINENGWIYTTVGQGKADVFQDGKHIEATWKKESHTAPTKFFDADGKEIQRNPGVTFFEITHPDVGVTIS